MELHTVVVVGAGLMGRGIAQVLASKGVRTYIVEPFEKARAEAVESIRSRVNREVQKGRLADADSVMAKITAVQDLSEVDDAVGLVIEAVPENLQLKQSVLENAEKSFTGSIFASNTSSIPIAKIASEARKPGKVIGMHWFNPPPVMELIEVVHSEQTDEATIDTIVEFSKFLGKTPIVVKDSPGFASSRLGVALGLEAIRMLEQGVASAEDIDKAMTLGYRHPMGPLELTDYIGLDTRLRIAEYMANSGLSPAFEIPELLRSKVRTGKLGRKSGEGFYKWKDGRKVS